MRLFWGKLLLSPLQLREEDGCDYWGDPSSQSLVSCVFNWIRLAMSSAPGARADPENNGDSGRALLHPHSVVPRINS